MHILLWYNPKHREKAGAFWMDKKDFVLNSGKLLWAAFKIYVENTTDMMFLKDTNLTYVVSSQAFAEMAGKQSVEQIIGKTDFEIFENQELAKRYVDDDRKLLESDAHMLCYIEPLADDHGQARYCTTSKYILRDKSEKVIGIFGVSRDITKEYFMRQRYQQELRYLFELPEDTYAALFMDIDDWRIIRHQRHTLGGNVLEICETMDAFAKNAVKRLADPEDMKTRAFYENLSKESMMQICNSGKRHYALEYLRRIPDGSVVWVRTDINFLSDPENGHLCAIWSLKNIDSEKMETMSLVRAAEYDEMTGCLNRAFTTKYIEETLEKSSHEKHALFAIDVDNFKSLNDTFGHQTGDEFLISLASVLKTCFRESDIVGRMGGDEFFVLMKNVPNSLIVAEKSETLLRMGREICKAYAGLEITLSIGVAMFPEQGINLDQLYASADGALYQAKNQGKNQFVFAPGKNTIL